MADSNAARGATETHRNGSVTADILQQGTGNAARDINQAGRDIINSMSLLATLLRVANKYRHHST
jgi:hypothetical protein